MNRLTLIIAILLAWMPLAAAGAPAIIPQPVNYTPADGSYLLPEKLTVGATGAHSGATAKTVAKYLTAAGRKASTGGFSKASVKVSLDTSLRDEQYRLTVTPGGVEIKAAGNTGLFYAVQSLVQLADASGDGQLPCCDIDDYPRFGYRGLMLDVVRCYIEPSEIKRIIDVAGRLKLNNVHLHLTDDNGWRLQIKKYPRLTDVGAWRVDRPELFPGRMNARSADEPATYGGFYTAAQMRDIVKYAAERNINIIPEIEMPAHSAAAIASYPELACPTVDKFVGVFPGIGGYDASIILCGGNEKVYEFITDVLDEVMDIFPSKYIHLGGDEANKAVWEKCPLCQQRIADEHLDGCEGLQAYLMDRINHYVRSRGRVAMGWDEVTYGNPKEDMVIFGWQGDGGVAIRDARASGRRFVLTPAKVMYLIRYQGPQWFEPWTYFGNNTLKDVYTYEPVGDDWTPQMREQLMGVQGSLWSEFCKTPADMQYQIFPRLLAVADVAWRPEGRADWEGFLPAVDAFLPTMERCGINYARSMYNLDHVVKGADGKLQVSVSCIRPDMEVRWSLNDSTLASSQVYTGEVTVDAPATLYAATFSGGRQMGRTLVLPLDFNKATGCKVTSPSCRNSLAYALTNGLRGSDRNSDFEWAGWWDGTAEFVVDLGKQTAISGVSLGVLVHSDICVAAPKHIYVYTSKNGMAYELAASVPVADELVYHKQARILDIDCGRIDATARYVKVVAVNPGRVPDGLAREGAATWMYFDEVSVH